MEIQKNKQQNEKLWNAAQTGRLETAKEALKNGADINYQSNTGGSTPLIVAAFSGRVVMVQFLLSQGANPNLKNKWGRTALEEARARTHLDTAAAIDKSIQQGPVVVVPLSPVTANRDKKLSKSPVLRNPAENLVQIAVPSQLALPPSSLPQAVKDQSLSLQLQQIVEISTAAQTFSERQQKEFQQLLEKVEKLKSEKLELKKQNELLIAENKAKKLALDQAEESLKKKDLQIKEEEELNCCVVCMTVRRNTILMPCMHLALCSKCCDKIKNQNKQCPTCRTPINGSIQCYIQQ